jgi:hypothetical protein
MAEEVFAPQVPVVFTPQAGLGPLAQAASTLQVHLDSDLQARLASTLLALPHSGLVQVFVRLDQSSIRMVGE